MNTILSAERLMRPSEVAAALSRHHGKHVSTHSANKWAKQEGIAPLMFGTQRRYRAADVLELLTVADPAIFAEVRVTAEDAVGGDIRNPVKHPVALAIRRALPAGSTVSIGTAVAVVTMPGFRPVTVALPEQAVRFIYAMRNRITTELPSFRLEIPCMEGAQ